jgi:spore coat polysaccharide biosynthesis protein SpsF (cytidylyltransferase family)
MLSQPNCVAVIDVGDCNTYPASQLAGRFAARRLGGQTLVHRIARRLSESTRLQQVVISGLNLPANLVTGVGARVMDLPYTHVCERLASVADAVDADWVAFVPGNRPFVDPALIDCLLNRAQHAESDFDYVGFCGHDGSWERVRHLGVAGEVCHADALRRLRRNIDRMPVGSEDDSLASCLTAAPGDYRMQFVTIPDALDFNDLRFAIEDEMDWELAELFTDHVGIERTEWQLLANLVRDNQALRVAMAERNAVQPK